jgi:transposase InsO family protein
VHRRPRLNPFGRQLVIERLQSGRSAAVVAEELGVSRATVYKWWRRFRQEGADGLVDRSSRPHSSPRRLPAVAEEAILNLRRQRKLGPHRLAALTGFPRSTCYQVLRRHQLHRLDWLDRPSGQLIRRYERIRPGELVHVDVKKLGRIPPGGGHWAHGRKARPDIKRGLGYEFVHSLVDDYTRFAYSEVLADEKGPTCAAFLRRAADFLAQHGIHVEQVMTDNAYNYRLSNEFKAALADLGARHLRTPAHHPQVNGKVERFNRTLLDEWAYLRIYDSNEERLSLLEPWLHTYNYHRTHTALGGRSPIERVDNLRGNYT